MLAVIGTVPDQAFPIVSGDATLKGDEIIIGDQKFPVNRGTPALLAAAIKTSEFLGREAPFAYLVGDIGLGDGCRRLYEYLTENLKEKDFNAITLHYFQPDIKWHDRFLSAIDKLRQRPILIADAGSMYVAKMSGHSQSYDLFTPDVGELAFLADEAAPHPFYTRGFILQEEDRVPELISRVYKYKNASRFLLVKGKQDYITDGQGELVTVDGPSEEAMEAMGGTGDTLTGIVSSLIESGIDIFKAAIIAARVNRVAGHYARPTPATQVMEIIPYIYEALADILSDKKEKVTG
ncbi:MAG TPA: NAD(P)H-hydrate dehydratase [Desulfobacteraceae bacterium]|nr:NAD(P)H-hydrate dehydratase [Desulfobacteraceae bacterium]